MTEFHSLTGGEPFIPDNTSVPQFFLEYDHPIRPKRPHNIPVFIADGSGREIGLEEVRHRTACLASGLSSRFQLTEDDVGKTS
jgi:4-coumarate--CoA ligase